MQRVVLNITPAELEKVTGDTSFYRNLLTIKQEDITFACLPDKWTKTRKAPRALMLMNRPYLPGWLRDGLLYTSRFSPLNPAWIGSGDILLSHVLYPLFLPRPKSEIPIIWSSQGISPPEYYSAYGQARYEDVVKVYKRLGKRATLLTVWTEDGAERMIAECPELAGRTLVVRPYLPLVAVKPRRYPKGTVRILFVGLNPVRKGLPQVLTALRSLGPLMKEVRFDIVSNPDAKSLIPSDLPNTHYHQPLVGDATAAERLAELFTLADIFIMPSHAETYGYVFVEAMARACAVIAPDLSHMPELVGPGGIIVQRHSTEEISAALRRLIEDRTVLAKMKRAAIEHYEREFSPARAIKGYVEAARRVRAIAGT